MRIFKQNQIISISSRVIEFWCFGLPEALGRGKVGGGGSGWMRVSPHMCTLMHTHAHVRTHAHKILQMATNMFIMILVSFHHPHVFPIFPMSFLSPPHHPCHPHIIPKPPFNPPPTATQISKNSITRERIKIF